MSINFQEHPQTGYAMRTWDNATLSDLTIAFAIDFNTPGELLTRKAAYGKYNNLLIGHTLTEKDLGSFVLKIADKMQKCKFEKINIAGNGLQTLSIFGYDQQYADDFMLNFLSQLNEQVFCISVRSGGQRGVDEAALKAGDKLGLETICLAPKHWMFRDINGRDIIGHEALFLKRFGEKYDATDIL